MSHKNIFAYTPPLATMPPFISVNEDEKGVVRVIVRSSAEDGSVQAVIELPPTEIWKLRKSLSGLGRRP